MVHTHHHLIPHRTWSNGRGTVYTRAANNEFRNPVDSTILIDPAYNMLQEYKTRGPRSQTSRAIQGLPYSISITIVYNGTTMNTSTTRYTYSHQSAVISMFILSELALVLRPRTRHILESAEIYLKLKREETHMTLFHFCTSSYLKLDACCQTILILILRFTILLVEILIYEHSNWHSVYRQLINPPPPSYISIGNSHSQSKL